MENAEKIQYQADLAAKLYEELGWESLSNVIGVGAFYRYIRLSVTTRLLILKTNSLDTADLCTVKIIIIPFMAL